MKIRCNVCANELNGFCKVKKSKVSVNKPRKCASYVYDESKVKLGEEIPSVRINYVEQEERRKTVKKELKELKRTLALQKEVNRKNTRAVIENVPNSGDNKHPLTGDLSKFTTTAANKE